MNGKMKGSGGLVAALLVVTAVAAMVPMAAGRSGFPCCMSGYKLDTNNNPIEGWNISVEYDPLAPAEYFPPADVTWTKTDPSGYWVVCFDYPNALEYIVTEELRVGWTQVRPVNGNYIVTMEDFNEAFNGKVANITGLNFTNEYTGPGTGTVGYWKTHPEAWPVDAITIGGVTYTKEDAIAIMETPERGDKTYTMFRELVCAKLNELNGNDASCISDTIFAADAWMTETEYPVGSNVRDDSTAWLDEGADLYEELNKYNSGLLCAPHISPLTSGTTTGTSGASTATETTIKEPGNGNKKSKK
jgi:hypothetical protein